MASTGRNLRSKASLHKAPTVLGHGHSSCQLTSDSALDPPLLLLPTAACDSCCALSALLLMPNSCHASMVKGILWFCGDCSNPKLAALSMNGA